LLFSLIPTLFVGLRLWGGGAPPPPVIKNFLYKKTWFMFELQLYKLYKQQRTVPTMRPWAEFRNRKLIIAFYSRFLSLVWMRNIYTLCWLPFSLNLHIKPSNYKSNFSRNHFGMRLKSWPSIHKQVLDSRVINEASNCSRSYSVGTET
jgi:hypothetical protein